MPSYTESRRVLSIRLSGAQTNDTDVGGIVIPAGREVLILGMKATVLTAAGASTSIKLVNSSNGTIAEVATTATGAKADATNTFPSVINAPTADDFLKLRISGTWGASSNVQVEVHMTEPGV